VVAPHFVVPREILDLAQTGTKLSSSSEMAMSSLG
jgi:hypothetical protein